MYYLIGWDREHKLHEIMRSKNYNVIERELTSGKYKIGRGLNDWSDLAIVTDIFQVGARKE